jgi:hypothetical protein
MSFEPKFSGYDTDRRSTYGLLPRCRQQSHSFRLSRNKHLVRRLTRKSKVDMAPEGFAWYEDESGGCSFVLPLETQMKDEYTGVPGVLCPLLVKSRTSEELGQPILCSTISCRLWTTMDFESNQIFSPPSTSTAHVVKYAETTTGALSRSPLSKVR